MVKLKLKSKSKSSYFNKLFKKKWEPKSKFGIKLKKFLIQAKTWYLTYFNLHLTYFIVMTFLGGLFLYLSDSQIDYWNGFLIAGGGLTGAGFPPLSFDHLSPAAYTLSALLMAVGGLVPLTLVPVILRRINISKQLAKFPKESKLTLNDLLEYRACLYLINIVVGYYVIIHFLGFLLLSTWSSQSSQGQEIFAEYNKTNYAPWAIYVTISAFNNVGFSTFSANFLPFQQAAFPLIVISAIAIFGNTGFPLMMRLIVVLGYKVSKGDAKHIFGYLLDHPRKCFTYLFLKRETIWLAIILLLFNLVQFVALLGLAWDSPSLSPLPPGYKVLNSLFTSIATRTSGFNCIDVASLPEAVLVLFIAMMYVSTTPVALTIRATNLSDHRPSKSRPQIDHFSSPISSSASSIYGDSEVERGNKKHHLKEQGEFYPISRDENIGPERIFELHMNESMTNFHFVNLPFSSREGSIHNSSERGSMKSITRAHRRSYEFTETTSTSMEASTSTEAEQRYVINETDIPYAEVVYDEADITGQSLFHRTVNFDHIQNQASELLFKFAPLHFIILFLICAIESQKLETDPGFSVLRITFEIASAFGDVGLSVGYPNSPYAFSSQWDPISKFLLVVVMWSGRQRGLPSSIDTAVLMTSEGLLQIQERLYQERKAKKRKMGKKRFSFRSFTSLPTPNLHHSPSHTHSHSHNHIHQNLNVHN